MTISIRSRRKSVVTQCLMSMAAFSSLAAGQGPEQRSGSASARLEEVVVTASKTGAQALQITPIAVSVIGSDMLEQQGLKNIKDIALYVPNLSVSRNISSSIISIRGIGSNGGSDPSITTQVDGVYIGSSIAFTEFFDVERVEVLRGPQGTLYGRNATGGTINFISRTPAEEVEGKLRVGFGNYNALETSAYLSGPVAGDSLRGSLAVTYQRHDPFFENIAPGGHDIASAKNGGLRAQLLWNLNPDLTAVTRADYFKADQYVESYNHLRVPLAAPLPLANSLVGSYRKVAIDGDQTLDLESAGISQDINWQINDSLSLTSITAYREQESDAFNDNDATEAFLLYFQSTSDGKQFSQEFNLKYSSDRFNFITGAYYYWEKNQPGSFVRIPPSPITPSERAATRGAFPELTTDSYAVFGQGEYQVTPDLRFLLGARYTIEDKEFDQNFGANSLNPATPGVNLPGFPIIFSEDRRDEALTPKIGLDYQLSDDVFLYASVTKGFKSGGFNGQATFPIGGYAPEEIWSYELGAKTEWLDRQLRLNATAFSYDYSDLQVRQLLGPGRSEITNAAEATVQGVELELIAMPTENLQLSGYVSWLDAKYDNFPQASIPGGFAPFVPNQNCTPAGCTIDASDNFLSDAPEWSGQLAVDYTIDLRSHVLRFHMDYAYRSERYFDTSNIPLSEQESYDILNFNMGFGPAGQESWQVEIYANNLTDEEYYQTISGNGAVPGGIVGDPRTYGVRANYSF